MESKLDAFVETVIRAVETTAVRISDAEKEIKKRLGDRVLRKRDVFRDQLGMEREFPELEESDFKE